MDDCGAVLRGHFPIVPSALGASFAVQVASHIETTVPYKAHHNRAAQGPCLPSYDMLLSIHEWLPGLSYKFHFIEYYCALRLLSGPEGGGIAFPVKATL